jgi:EAL domain-containing protein (putative c-di-GMP-specific phosphodiesterase class I)
VVAEGIETADQLDLLAAMGCRYAQGYHLSRPEPADQLIRRLSPGLTADFVESFG